MAKEHKFFSNVNLHGNALKLAKLIIANRSLIQDDDVIDKQYVDEALEFSSDLLDDVNVELQPLGGIETKSQLTGSTINEIIDELLFPAVPHDYVLPVATNVIILRDQLTDDEIDLLVVEIGRSVYGDFSTLIQLNDSVGLVDASSIIHSIINTDDNEVTAHLLEDFTTSPRPVYEDTRLRIQINYDDAAVQVDSHGDDDIAGSTENPIFVAGSLIQEIEYKGSWPALVCTSADEFDIGDYTDEILTEVETVLDTVTDYINEIDDELVVEQLIELGAGIKTIAILVKSKGISLPVMTIKLDDEDVTSLFERSILEDTQSRLDTQTTDYELLVMNIPAGLINSAVLNIDIK